MQGDRGTDGVIKRQRRPIRRPAAEGAYKAALAGITASQLTTGVLLEAADGMSPDTRRAIEQGDILERMILQLLWVRAQA
jgi:hypothetical protein